MGYSFVTEDNLTIITVNLIDCDEATLSDVIEAVSVSGLAEPVSAVSGCGADVTISFCTCGAAFVNALIALAAEGDRIPDYHCRVMGNMTRITVFTEKGEYISVLRSLSCGGVRISILDFCRDCVRIYTSGVYTGLALNVLNGTDISEDKT